MPSVGEIIKTGRGPLIVIHYIERTVHGNGIAIKVYGEMKVGAGEVVYARELKLNTIEVLTLTPEYGLQTRGFLAGKWIYNKGEYDNYASIDVWDTAGHRIIPGSAYAPEADGSIWLNFIALGE
jgi:hypothetical protein